jgi:uncharacterized coiled-coil protein SlyX
MGLREKRLTRIQVEAAKVELLEAKAKADAEAAAHVELARIRDAMQRDYAERVKKLEERIAKLEEHINTLENFTAQYRRILDEERTMYSKLKERCEGQESVIRMMQRRLVNAGLGSESEFPLPPKGG